MDAEFILRQETKRQKVLKELIMPTQFIRTSSLVKVAQLKKLVQARIKATMQDVPVFHDIQMFIYTQRGCFKLRGEQTVGELLEQGHWNTDKALIANKRELSLSDNPKTMETIWVCFSLDDQ